MGKRGEKMDREKRRGSERMRLNEKKEEEGGDGGQENHTLLLS